MSSITQLEYVLAVDRERHFGRAAESCHVSQPSLSSQVQKLEEELGVVIFDRSKKPILVTEAGKEIIAQAKIIVREHSKLESIADGTSHEPKGEFHLAVIPTLAPYLIPLFVAEFSKTYPKVYLKISEYKTEDIIKMLVNDEIDAGILVTPLEDERIIERHLFFEPFYAYAAESHEMLKKKSLTEGDMLTRDLWLLEEGHCFRDQVLKVCSLEHKNKVLNNVEFSSGNLETLKHLVKRSNGYTLLPELAVFELDEKEKMTHVRKFKKPAPTREVSIVHSRFFLKESIINSMEESILSSLPKEIRSLKRKDIEIIGIN
jgi:LysR family transcriptional regulator, hydrogen peroxide-inducible genes activator